MRNPTKVRGSSAPPIIRWTPSTIIRVSPRRIREMATIAKGPMIASRRMLSLMKLRKALSIRAKRSPVRL